MDNFRSAQSQKIIFWHRGLQVGSRDTWGPLKHFWEGGSCKVKTIFTTVLKCYLLFHSSSFMRCFPEVTWYLPLIPGHQPGIQRLNSVLTLTARVGMDIKTLRIQSHKTAHFRRVPQMGSQVTHTSARLATDLGVPTTFPAPFDNSLEQLKTKDNPLLTSTSLLQSLQLRKQKRCTGQCAVCTPAPYPF